MKDGSEQQVFTDAAWAVWEPLIEGVRPRGKTPPKDLRRTISAIVWRHQNGAKWRSIPAELGPWWLAAQLFIGASTVKTHTQRLYEKLGVSDRAAAVAEGMRRGLLE